MDDSSLPMGPRRKRPSRPTKVAAFVAAFLGGIILPGALAWSVLHVTSVSSQVRTNQISNTRALCALRADVETRVAEGETFLLLHPKGIPGIPAATLKNSLNGEKRTVKALRFVRCSNVAPSPPSR